MSLTLAQANTIIGSALAYARDNSVRPMAVVVLDAGAHPIAFQREDGATHLRLDIARVKAKGALGMGMDTAVLAERAKDNPVFFQSLAAALTGQVVFAAGGVLVLDDSGTVIGAVGTSGDTGDVDADCAIAGIAAAGLKGGFA